MLLDVPERNSMAITPNVYTESHTVRGRTALKLVERFGNGSFANFTRDQFSSDPLRANLLTGNVKVRRVKKNVCKLNTRRVRLSKVTQHEKKYFLNCSVRENQRLIKLKYRV